MASDEKLERIVKEYEAGKSVTRIVRELGIPKHWVYFALGSKGISLPMRPTHRGTDTTLLRPMRNTSARMTTVPASIMKQLGVDKDEVWEAEWSIVDRKMRIVQAEMRPFKGEAAESRSKA